MQAPTNLYFGLAEDATPQVQTAFVSYCGTNTVDVDAVAALLRGDPAWARLRNSLNRTPLAEAVRANNLQLCKVLLQYRDTSEKVSAL